MPAGAMRQWFNSNVLARERQLNVQVRTSKHPSSPQSGEPYCTRTEIVQYKDGNCTIALACRFLRTDGTLGASGKPDPKWIKVNGQIYKLEEVHI